MHARRMPSIDRYMARLIAVPLFATLLIAAMLLVLDRMLRLFDFVASEGGPVSVVWQMLANLLPEYLGLGVPIGLTLGILLAFRRLATSSELDVMLGVGLSYGRLLRVPYYYALALGALNLAIVGYIQPLARYNYERLQFELRSGALGASIKVGEFVQLGDRMTLRIEESHDDGRDLRGIFVRVESADRQTLAVTADAGRFLATEDKDTIIFRLSRGVLVHTTPDSPIPRTLTFTAHDLPIDLPRIENFRTRGERKLELTLPQLVQTGLNEGASETARNENVANLHFRLVEVAMMAFLPLLGVALGVPPKRSTSSLGVFLAVVMLVTYHKINEYAEGLGGLGFVDPAIALWAPFAVFVGLIVWMYRTLAHVPGGQPIGALERSFGKLGRVVRNWLPTRRREVPV
jgi:lipopolysaccharide export system permease protein